MSVAPPPPAPTRLIDRFARDIKAERAAKRAKQPFPPGPDGFSMARTRAFAREPLPLLLDAYRDYGPVFTIRILHTAVVFMLGPEANHYMTVSHAKNFRWRDGGMGDLMPLLGDGMLTIDGDYHRRARQIMLPAFHRERIAAAVDTMTAETEQALAAWEDGARLDLYAWTRALALRVAMRALFGFDPDRANGPLDPAGEFEHALSFWGRDYLVQMLRGPRTPWARMNRARDRLDRLIFEEVARRRAQADHGGEDIMSLLLEARDEDGTGFSDQEIRDQVMTLLFAGHDTTTATITFLFYELARAPEVAERLAAEVDRVVGDGTPTAAQLASELLELDMAVDETLRLYPAAWVGPRRSVEPFEFAGKLVPGGVNVDYCSWASHRIPEVFPDPDAFVLERWTPEARAQLPKGAYVPFGGGSRTCIGMRFGQMEIKAIAALILARFRLELVPGWKMEIRQTPTLGPRGGMPVVARAR